MSEEICAKLLTVPIIKAFVMQKKLIWPCNYI